MGWTYGWSTRKAVVEHLLDQSTLTVIKHASTGYGHRLWVAFEHKTDPAPGGQKRFVALFLINGTDLDGNGKWAQFGWGYKDIDEASGPCDVDCPLSILDAAGPDSDASGYGATWRVNVRAYWQARADNRAAAKSLKRGDRVHIKGVRDNPFTVAGVSPRLTGYGASGRFYRLPRVRDIEVLAQ